MATTVDERIVEAKFDARDFERGVDKTIKKLDELKDSFNMKDTGKTITEFAQEASSGVEKAGNALQKLSDRITTFRGQIQQQVISGLANEVSSAFLKMEHSILSFAKTLSTGQISSGMSKYTEILNGVRTMTAAGISQEKAYKAVKRLGDYSDQTSYSLSQMTSGMSKLVAAGMDVENAEKSMEGLANMAASAGVNIYDAQRAFLNFSQAYSSGNMRIQDWMSFESLNMATENVMSIFMQAGVEAKTLTETVDKEGKKVYKTINTTNKKVKANKEVAAKGFRDTLSSGWLDRETMKYATATLSYFEDLGVDLNELSSEELKQFATRAFQAAKEARSFTDVMGTLKDVIATGWATTFELIFGKLDKATEFFTWLSDSNLANAIYKVGEFRNAVLTAWGADFAEGGIFRKGKTGRDQLVAALHNIDDLIGSIQNTLEDLLPEEWNGVLKRNLTFAEMIGKKMGIASYNFKKATENIRNFFAVEREVENEENGEMEKRWFLKDEYANRLKRIGEGLSALGGIFQKFSSIASDAFSSVVKVLRPVFGGISDAVETILGSFTELNQNDDFFSNIRYAIENFLKVIEPFMEPLGKFMGFLGKVAKFFLDMAISTVVMNIELIADALGLVIELFGGKSAQKAHEGTGIIEGWGNSIVKFGDSCKKALGTIKEFFETVFEDIRNIFGINQETKGEEGNVFDGVKKFFETNEFVQNAKQWFRDLPGRVWEAIKKASSAIKKTAEKIWNSVGDFLLGKKVSEKVFNSKTGKYEEVTKRVKEGFSKWLDDTCKSIIDWLKKTPEHVKNLWQKISEFLFGKDVEIQTVDENGQTTIVTKRVKSGFSKWLDNTVDAVKDWISSVPGKVKELWQKLVDKIYEKTVLDGVTVEDGDDVAKPIKDKILEIFKNVYTKAKDQVKEWIETLGDKIKTLWQNFIDKIYDKTVLGGVNAGDTDANTVTIKDKIVKIFHKVYTNVKSEIKQWLKDVGEKFTGFWKNLVDKVYDKTVLEGVTAEDTETKTLSIKDKIVEIFKTTFNKAREGIEEFIGKSKNTFKTLWKNMVYALFGKNGFREDIYTNVARYSSTAADQYKKTWEEENPAGELVLEAFKEWWDKTKESVKNWFTEFPKKITDLWDTLVSKIYGEDVVSQIKDPETGEIKTVTDKIRTGFGKWLDATIVKVKEWFTGSDDQLDFHGKVRKLWNDILTAIFGTRDQNKTTFSITDALGNVVLENVTADQADSFLAVYKDQDYKMVKDEKSIEDKALDVIQNLASKIGGFLSTLPAKIAEGMRFKVGLFDDAIKALTAKINEKVDASELLDGEEVVNSVTESAEKAEGEVKGNSGFLNAVLNIGLDLYNMITNTVPKFIVAGWNYVKGNASGWVDIINNFFKDNGIDWNTIEKDISHIGEEIRKKIEGIPDMVRGAISTVQSLFKKPVKKTTYTIFDEFDNVVQEGLSTDELDSFLRSYKGKVSKIAQNVEDATEDSDLWKTIKGVGSSVGKAIVDFAPDVLNFGSKVFGNINTWIKEFSKKMTERNKNESFGVWLAKQVTDDDETASELYEAVKSFGETLYAFITETMPGFIEAAIKEVINGVPKIISESFGGLFSGLFGGGGSKESGEEVAKGAINEFYDGLYSGLRNNVGVSSSFENKDNPVNKALRQHFSGTLSNLFTVDTESLTRVSEEKAEEEAKEIEKSIITRQRLIEYLQGKWLELNGAVDRTNLGYDISILESMSDEEFDLSKFKFTYKNGDAEQVKELLNGLEVYNEEVEKEIEAASNTLTWDEQRKQILDDLNTKMREAQEERSKVYKYRLSDDKNLYQQYRDADDKFQRYLDAIDKARRVKRGDPFDLSSIFEDKDLTKANAKKKTDGLNTLVSGFSDIFSSMSGFFTSDLGKITVAAVSIGFVLAQFKDILTISDEFEEYGYAEKWSAIKIIVIGILGVLGWLAYLSAQTDDTALQSTLDTFDRLVVFIERIGEVLKWLAILNLGESVADAAESLFDSRSAAKTAKAGKSISKGWDFITNLFGGFLTKLTELGIFKVGSDIIGSGLENLSDSLTSILDNTSIGIQAFVDNAVPVISNLASIVGTIDDAITVVGRISELIEGIHKLGSIKMPISATEWAEEVNKDLWGSPGNTNEETAKKFKELAEEETTYYEDGFNVLMTSLSFMSSLSKSINNFSQVEDAFKTVEDMTKLVSDNRFTEFVNALLTAYSKIIFPNSDKNTLKSAALDLQFLASGFDVFTDSIKTLSMDNATVLTVAMENLERLAKLINESDSATKLLGGETKLSKFGDQLRSFGGSLKSFFNSVSNFRGFGTTEVANTKQRISTIIDIANGLAEASAKLGTFGSDNLSELMAEDKDWEGLAKNIGSFITETNRLITDDIDLNRVRIIATGVEAVADIMHGIGAMVSSFTKADEIPQYFAYFLKGLSETFLGKDGLLELGTKSGKNLTDGLTAGIEGNVDPVLTAAKALADGIIDKFNFTLKIESPSKVMMGIGEYIDQGLAIGMDNASDAPIKAATGLSYGISSALKSGIGKEMQETTEEVTDQTEEAKETILSSVGSIFDRLNKAASTNNIGGRITNLFSPLMLYGTKISMITKMFKRYSDENYPQITKIIGDMTKINVDIDEQAKNVSVGHGKFPGIMEIIKAWYSDTHMDEAVKELYQDDTVSKEFKEAMTKAGVRTIEDLEKFTQEYWKKLDNEAEKSGPKMVPNVFGMKVQTIEDYYNDDTANKETKDAMVEAGAETLQDIIEVKKKIAEARNKALEEESRREAEEMAEKLLGMDEIVRSVYEDPNVSEETKKLIIDNDVKTYEDLINLRNDQMKQLSKQNDASVFDIFDADSLWELVTGLLKGRGNYGRELLDKAGDYLADGLLAIQGVMDNVTLAFNAIPDLLPNALATIDEIYENLTTGGYENSKTTKANVLAAFMRAMVFDLKAVAEHELVPNISGVIDDALAFAGEKLKGTPAGMVVSMVSGFVQQIKDSAGDGVEIVKAFAEKLEGVDPGILLGVGKTFMSRIFGGLTPEMEESETVTDFLASIKNYFNDNWDLDPTITPVVDMSNVELAAKEIDGLIDGQKQSLSWHLANVMDAVNAANPKYGRTPEQIARDYSETIGKIVSGIAELNGTMGNASKGMSGMRVVMDTGAVVGAIVQGVDSELGRLEFYSDREG